MIYALLIAGLGSASLEDNILFETFHGGIGIIERGVVQVLMSDDATRVPSWSIESSPIGGFAVLSDRKRLILPMLGKSQLSGTFHISFDLSASSLILKNASGNADTKPLDIRSSKPFMWAMPNDERASTSRVFVQKSGALVEIVEDAQGVSITLTSGARQTFRRFPRQLDPYVSVGGDVVVVTLRRFDHADQPIASSVYVYDNHKTSWTLKRRLVRRSVRAISATSNSLVFLDETAIHGGGTLHRVELPSGKDAIILDSGIVNAAPYWR